VDNYNVNGSMESMIDQGSLSLFINAS